MSEKMAEEFRLEFERVWTQTADNVLAYMYCKCGRWADACDLLQNCYLRAFQGWENFDGRGTRNAWIFGIARKTCADWFRTKKRQDAVISLADMDEFNKAVCKNPNADEIEVIWSVVKGLDAEQREVIQLRFAAGLGYAEIAQTLDVPIGTVRSRLHRGLKEVREKIGE